MKLWHLIYLPLNDLIPELIEHLCDDVSYFWNIVWLLKSEWWTLIVYLVGAECVNVEQECPLQALWKGT